MHAGNFSGLVTVDKLNRFTRKNVSIQDKLTDLSKLHTGEISVTIYIPQYRMRNAIYIPPNTKDLAINLTMVGYGNRQNAITLARANNSDFLRALKHLMETRL